MKNSGCTRTHLAFIRRYARLYTLCFLQAGMHDACMHACTDGMHDACTTHAACTAQHVILSACLRAVHACKRF